MQSFKQHLNEEELSEAAKGTVTSKRAKELLKLKALGGSIPNAFKAKNSSAKPNPKGITELEHDFIIRFLDKMTGNPTFDNAVQQIAKGKKLVENLSEATQPIEGLKSEIFDMKTFQTKFKNLLSTAQLKRVSSFKTAVVSKIDVFKNKKEKGIAEKIFSGGKKLVEFDTGFTQSFIMDYKNDVYYVGVGHIMKFVD